MREYYEAYDDRYSQVHSRSLAWTSSVPTPIVLEVLARFGVRRADQILEIGCGEGRDAAHLLSSGYDLLATDVSQEAIRWCRNQFPEHRERFRQMDCLKDRLDGKFAFLYAVAVLHMLVRGEDRAGFYRFFREHLAEDGIGLICTMGDGEVECASDISTAFDLQKRTHQQTGEEMAIAGTSCRMVSRETFQRELTENGLRILELGLTASPPEFSSLLYAVVSI